VVKTFKERKKMGEFTGRYGPANKNNKIIKKEEIDLFYYMRNGKS
jgi:hypothetical protein